MGVREDYRAVGADPKTQTIRDMADRVAVEAGVGRGEDHRVGATGRAPPVQPGGPRLLIGATGPKSTRMAAEWADGLAGITLDLDTGRQNELFDVARAAWAEAGKPKPHLATSFWFALGEADAARRRYTGTCGTT